MSGEDRIVLDPRTRLLDGGRTLLGGDPGRVLRLTESGATTLQRLLGGREGPTRDGPTADGQTGDDGQATEALARRLIDAGLAHPRPAGVSCRTVTVVIPVRDRPRQIERCLSALFAAEAPGRVIVVDDGSANASALAAVCGRFPCELIRCERCRGPAAARNMALQTVKSGIVALLDSDCVPEPGWITTLCGTLAADPELGAVAPRVRPIVDLDGAPEDGGEPSSGSGRNSVPTAGALARFAAVRSPLDLGPWPSLVRPGGRTAYLPTAALLTRREALGETAAPFDEALRYGEDVDLVWRMIDRGWSVRYEPAAVVAHREPERLWPWLTRRFRYGSSAGPLAMKHPERLAPITIRPRTAAVLGTAVAAMSVRRIPSTVAGVSIALHAGVAARELYRHGVPPRAAIEVALAGLAKSAAAIGRASTMLGVGPLAAALAHRLTRRPTLALLLASPVCDYVRLRPALDPLRFAAFAIADDVSYGAGVWAGSLRARTWRPLRPRINSPTSRSAASTH